MSDVRGKKLEVLCYVEGYRIPIKNVTISCQLGVPSIATIDIPPACEASAIYPTTHIVIFVRYSAFGDTSAMRHQYKLMFHGEITGVRSSKNGINMSYQILAIDSRSYLNRLPSHMLFKLYDSGINPPFFPNISDDSSFYGIPSDDAIKAYFESMGVLVDGGRTTLVDYVNRILRLLKYQGTNGYNYYSNAEYRYNIQGNHSVVDYGNTFENLWGAITKSCILNNTTQRIVESNGTTMDALAANLGPLGYMYVSTLFPRYDAAKKRLVEYIVTRDLINHRVPRFNYIYVDRDDNFDAMIVPTRITALKYKYKTANEYPINNDVYPKDCMKNGVRGSFQMTEEEKLYGINRESVEMDYYYNAFLKETGASYTSGDNKTNLEKKIQYDFIVKRTSRNSLSIAKSGFYPQYVMGVPTIAYDPMTERIYRGNISRLAYSINPESGSCVTTMEAVNVMKIDDKADIDKDRSDVNPFGATEFITGEKAFYKNHFYGNRDDDKIMLASGDIGDGSMKIADYEAIIDRPTCTMFQYLSMYYGEGEIQDDNSIPEDIFDSYATESKAGEARLAYQRFYQNADYSFKEMPSFTGKPKMYFLFIEERRVRAQALYLALKERILYV